MIIVVLPAYNEQEVIQILIENIRSISRKYFAGMLKILIVDDGSADYTVDRVRAIEGEDVILVLHGTNKGLGEAIKTGLRAALTYSQEVEAIITMDADNTHLPGLLPRMLTSLEEGFDVVIASRYQPGARVMGLDWFRQLMSLGMSWLFRVLIPVRGVRDYSCGYRAYRASMLARAFEQWGDHFISQSGFSCMVDILLKLNRLGAVITEVPMLLRYDLKEGPSKMRVWRTIRDTLWLAWREKKFRMSGKKMELGN